MKISMCMDGRKCGMWYYKRYYIFVLDYSISKGEQFPPKTLLKIIDIYINLFYNKNS